MDGLPREFRKWSILAFMAESIAVILTFLFLVIFLKWVINGTLMYILFFIMVISAALLLITRRIRTEK